MPDEEVSTVQAAVNITLMSDGRIKTNGFCLTRPILNMLILTGHQDLLGLMPKETGEVPVELPPASGTVEATPNPEIP